MAIHFDFSGMENLPEPHGLPASLLDPSCDRARSAWEQLLSSPPEFLTELDTPGLVAAVQDVASKLPPARNVVVLGIGGSALGARTIQESLAPGAESPRLWVLDNVDPHSLEQVATQLELDETVFLTVSKSGSTVETVAQFLYFQGLLEQRGVTDWQRRFVIITDPESGPLRELATRNDLLTLPVPPAVGGRFSVLTAVGLLPAALLGVDPETLLDGARRLRDSVLQTPASAAASHPLCRFVSLHHGFAEHRGATLQVLMTYCDRLKTFADWFVQLWGESLGKRHDLAGRQVDRGSTPLRAVGSTDQHSMVQLFVEGPRDKQFLFLGVREPEAEAPLPTAAGKLHADFEYLSGCNLRQLFDAQLQGTMQGLRAAQRPVGLLEIDRVDGKHLGALFTFFELATVLAGQLYEVNPYGQPGVEAGKIAAFARMGRPGYQEKARELFGDAEESAEPSSIEV